jgi:hypothetical protein
MSGIRINVKEKRNAYERLVTKLEMKRPLGI